MNRLHQERYTDYIIDGVIIHPMSAYTSIDAWLDHVRNKIPKWERAFEVLDKYEPYSNFMFGAFNITHNHKYYLEVRDHLVKKIIDVLERKGE